MFLRILMGSLFVLILNNVAWSMGSKSSSDTPTPSEPKYIFIPNKGNPLIVYTNTKQSHTCLEADDINGKNARVIDCDEAYTNHTNHSHILKSTLNNLTRGKKECRAVIDRLSFLEQRKAGIRVGCNQPPVSRSGQPTMVAGVNADKSDDELSTCHTEESEKIADDPSFPFRNTSSANIFGSCQDMLNFTVVTAGAVLMANYQSGKEPEKPEKKYCQRPVAQLTNLAQPQNYKNPNAPISNFVLMLEDNAAVASSKKYKTVKSYIQDLIQPLNGDIAAVLNHGTSTNPHWMIHIKTPPISLIDASTKIKEIFANDTKNAKPSNQPKESTDCNIKMLAADFPVAPNVSPDLPKMSQSAAFIAKPSNYDFESYDSMRDIACIKYNCMYSELFRMSLNVYSIVRNYNQAIKNQYLKDYSKKIDLMSDFDFLNSLGQIYSDCNDLESSSNIYILCLQFADNMMNKKTFIPKHLNLVSANNSAFVSPGSMGSLPAIMLRSAYGKLFKYKNALENSKVNIFLYESHSKVDIQPDGRRLANWNFTQGASIKYGIEGENLENIFTNQAQGAHAGVVIETMAGYNGSGYKTMGTFPSQYRDNDYKNIYLTYGFYDSNSVEALMPGFILSVANLNMRNMLYNKRIPIYKKIGFLAKYGVCTGKIVGGPYCNDDHFIGGYKNLVAKPDIINASFGTSVNYLYKSSISSMTEDLNNILKVNLLTARALQFDDKSQSTNGVIVYSSGNNEVDANNQTLLDPAKIIIGLMPKVVLAGNHQLVLHPFAWDLKAVNTPNYILPSSFFADNDVIKILGENPRETFFSTPFAQTAATINGIKMSKGTSYSAPHVSLAIADMIFAEKYSRGANYYKNQFINSEYIRQKYLASINNTYSKSADMIVSTKGLGGPKPIAGTQRSMVLRQDCVLIQSLADLNMTTKSTQYPQIAQMLQEFDEAFMPSRDECAATKTVFVGP